jgi:cyclase
MLKTRVIPSLLLKDFGLVKGTKFDSWRRVGGALQSIRVYNLRDVDELLLLDIGATPQNRPPDFAEIDNLADYCHMPLTVGGGVRSIADIGDLLKVGADKVAINSAALENPELIAGGARLFGSQCIVAAIDFRRLPDGSNCVVSRCGAQNHDMTAEAWAKRVEALGAGEILLTSVDRDGMMEGYDLEVTRAVAQAVSIPVIASGGCGRYEDMGAVLTEGQANAVAAASIFHFTEQTPIGAKRYLKSIGIEVRL